MDTPYGRLCYTATSARNRVPQTEIEEWCRPAVLRWFCETVP